MMNSYLYSVSLAFEPNYIVQKLDINCISCNAEKITKVSKFTKLLTIDVSVNLFTFVIFTALHDTQLMLFC